MIKANLKKDYPLMSKNFVIFTSAEEVSFISSLINSSNCSEALMDLNKFNLDQIKNFRELSKNICLQHSISGFQLNNLYFFLKDNFDFNASEGLYISPEGLFESREEYHKWQQLYGLLKPIEIDE